MAQDNALERYTTRDPDEFRSWVAARSLDHERRVRPHASGFAFAAETAVLGGMRFLRSRYTAVSVQVITPPLPLAAIAHTVSGHSTVRWRGGLTEVVDRGVTLLPPYGTEVISHSTDTVHLGLPVDVVARVAAEESGLDPAQLRFTGLEPVSRAAEQQVRAALGYVVRGIHTRALDPPLLRAAAEHLLAATMLSTFPNTAMNTELRTPRDPASPAVVRRAVAFIDARAGEPITLADIADAAGVVPRTLQYAFRRHRDTPPTAYLRTVRLARAHEELVAAQPGDGTTVQEVARRWGYARPHHFAAAYRLVYGRSPSETLRS